MAPAEMARWPHGHWLWNVSTRLWVWNDPMYRIYGYRPHDVVPDAELLLAHTAEHDRAGVRRDLAQLRDNGTEFAAVTHIRRADGSVAPVATIGHASPTLAEVRVGWVVPLDTGRAAVADNDAATGNGDATARQIQNLEAALESRDVIGQAKGALRARMGIGDAAAFDTLRWISQNTNLRLATVAERLVVHLTDRTTDRTDATDDRVRFTQLFLDFVEDLRQLRPTSAGDGDPVELGHPGAAADKADKADDRP
ncbi:PAS and ANTAR domain-containing protein [Pseudonocardia sp. TRM90224]|uniref:PAS and ANTAR domain-containing protein n=1 Tax=Pseudonocardia sp. TRM90224 TaxID=2812678 RepID=UPI001E55853B|nr:PAS and ANTAR domain-containing protein [Pseudonocardia sp. TRM90224]